MSVLPLSLLFIFRPTTTTTEKIVASDDSDAFLVCSDDTCFEPTVIDEEEEEPDLNAAASARLPDDNLRIIFEQMALRQNQVKINKYCSHWEGAVV